MLALCYACEIGSFLHFNAVFEIEISWLLADVFWCVCSLIHLFKDEAIKITILCSVLLCVTHGDVLLLIYYLNVLRRKSVV